MHDFEYGISMFKCYNAGSMNLEIYVWHSVSNYKSVVVKEVRQIIDSNPNTMSTSAIACPQPTLDPRGRPASLASDIAHHINVIYLHY